MATKGKGKIRKVSAMMQTFSHKHEKNVAKTADVVQQEINYDIQDILTNSLINSEIMPNAGSMRVQDILYNTTPAMRQLAYKSGFSIGKELCKKSGNGAEALFRVLEKAGFGKVLYYPFEDQFVIKSTQSASAGVRLNGNTHAYECGVIAGYLSAFTGMEICTAETECVYNNAPACKFESRPGSSSYQSYGMMGLDHIIEAISNGVNSASGNVQQDYYMMSMLPLTNEPLLSEISKILYLSGEKLAEGTDKRRVQKSLRQMAKYFDIEDVKIEGREEDKVMTLKYKQYNSMNQFVSLSASMFAGFVSGLYGSHLEMETKARADKSYTVRLSLKANNK